MEIDRGEQLVAADIPCGYGALYASVMCRGKATIVESLPEKVTVVRVDAITCTAKARIR